MTQPFPAIRLKGKLRPSQAEVVEIARQKLAAGKTQLHIVAPPGSGKTILGLFLWAECVKRPTLVLSPNSAIQSQWSAKVELFECEADRQGLVSVDPKDPALLTSLTYQSVTLPRRGDEDLDSQARELWIEILISDGQAQTPEEAQVWIDDLATHNPRYHEQRLSAYRKQVRDRAAREGQSLDMLHASSLATWERLRECGLGMVVFDECHHLVEHWGRVMAGVHEMLGRPIVVGLTATPPDRDGKHPEDLRRYDEFFGEIDYEVPVPAVVKDGFLAPYQDLVYFVRPAADELQFIAQADDDLHALVEELCRSREPAASSTAASTTAAYSPAAEANSPATAVVPAHDLSNAAPAIASTDTTAEGNPRAPDDRRKALPAPVRGGMSLLEWLRETLQTRRLATGIAKDWPSFERKDPDFAQAARVLLLIRDEKLPAEIPAPMLVCPLEQIPELSYLVPVLDRYLRHYLRRSPDGDDQRLAEQAIRRLRMLGMQITETGCRACASPVGRVMAYSRSKLTALAPILRAEVEALGNSLRAVVIADFEKSGAMTAEVGGLLDPEAGGAVAAFKALLADPVTDALDPILVTGSSVLVDDDLAATFEPAAREWLRQSGADAQLEMGVVEGFHIINGSGPDWCPRVYVAMITELFQRGLTRCLVGTRGLLGEGWDANKVNVLIDLTTVTTSMTVNQLRGRSLRLDNDAPQKLSDNWDVVCLAPEFTKGLDDYKRFLAKHEKLYGVTDDGAIEKGVGHVHAAFTELRPEGIEDNVDRLNAEMLQRVGQRTAMRERWKIGEPYRGQPQRTVEARVMANRERNRRGFPPFARSRNPWTEHSLAQAIGQAIAEALFEAKLLKSRPQLHTSDRAGGYTRLFLEHADQDDNAVFATSLHEALAPLDQQPRYLIPRDIVRVEPTWIGQRTGNLIPSWLRPRLPDTLTKLLEKRTRERAMWHAVPSSLAKNKELVEIYQKHWNRHVSPGKAIYGLREEGDRILATARAEGLSPSGSVHEKDVFF